MSKTFADPAEVMRRAIELARGGEGHVEPNPMVGAVIVDAELRFVAEGFHELYGGPHAELHALVAAGPRARGATLFVTLEPCCHVGKTPPCVDAVIASGVRRVVVGMQDPYHRVAGRGIARLRAAGLEVEVGLCEAEVRRLNAPFCMAMTQRRPWVHAKWAMTWDGRIASRTGHSRWVSNPASRGVAHALRGRMDAIVVGIGTALADDPLLTARPPGPRRQLRIVLDSALRLPLDSQLVRTAGEERLIVACGSEAPASKRSALEAARAEVLPLPAAGNSNGRQGTSIVALLQELLRRECTHVLVEGGSRVLGSFFDQGLIDEVHAFIAPKLLGGDGAPGPIAGVGLAQTPEHATLEFVEYRELAGDLYVHGVVRRDLET